MDERKKFRRIKWKEFIEMQLFNELRKFFEWHPGKNHLYYFAHEHRLTFYHQKPVDDNKIRCVACENAIEYANAVYGCRKTKCQTTWLHKSCAELPREIKKHPFHAQHPLVHINPKTSPSAESNIWPLDLRVRKCSGCDLFMDPLWGDIYGCTECTVFFHKYCLELPPEIKHFSHPSHPLSLKQESGKFCCGACSEDHYGLNYSCERCRYHLGIRCIINKDTKRYGNPLGHVLKFQRKQPSECRRSVCLVCRRRINWQPVFHCKECKFSLHRDCVLPFALPLLPDTFESKKHPGHSLTLTNYSDRDIRPQRCDVCDQPIPQDSSFYYCKDCDFAEDLTCVLSERCLSLAHKVDYVERLDTVPIVINIPSLTVKEEIESIAPGEMEELNKVVKDAIGETVAARRKLICNQQDDGNEFAKYSDQPFRLIMQIFESKSQDKKFGLSYYDIQSQAVEIHGCKIPKNLKPVFEVLMENFGESLNPETEESKIKSPGGRTFIFMILCAAIYSLCTVEEVDAYQLFTYWDCFEIARKAGFEIEFAFNRLRKATHAYLGLSTTNCSDPNNKKLDEEMKRKKTEMEKLHKTRRHYEALMQGVPIEIVGKNTWNQSEEFMLQEEEEDEEEEEEDDDDEVVPRGSFWEEEEEDDEEEQGPSTNTTEDTVHEMTEQEERDKTENHQGRSSGMLKRDTTKVGEEKSCEMPELREQERDKTKNAIDHQCRPGEIFKRDTTKLSEEKSCEMPESREQEWDETENAENHQGRPSEILKQDTAKVSEEKSCEMLELKEQEQEQNKTENARDHQDRPSEMLKSDTKKVGEEKLCQMLESREQEWDETRNGRDHQGKPSEMLKLDTTKEGEEKSSEMLKPREQKQDIIKLPNPWNCHDTSKKTESSKLGGQEGQTATLENLANKIRDFNKNHWSSSGNEVTCFHCKQSMPGRIADLTKRPSTSYDPKKAPNLCTACRLPILEGKIDETYHCPHCKIFVHEFCVKYPPNILHPLHLLHPLTLENPKRFGKIFECNVCGEICRGGAYYFCDGCKFYLEVQCVFQEPIDQSRCHGKVFRLPLKQSTNQNPRGCFACGETIITGSSSSTDFLRCLPCNVNLHVKCPISSRIIRSFHRHPLYFNRDGPCDYAIPSNGYDCNFCKKRMKSMFPAYSCEVCGDNFHIDCATSNLSLLDDVDTNGSH